MDFGDLLWQAARTFWRAKTLWWLALLPGCAHAAGSVGRLWLFGETSQTLAPLATSLATNPEQFLFLPNSATLFNDVSLLALGLVALLVAGLGYWLLYTLAEAAIVTTTLAVGDGRFPTFRQSLAAGSRLLGRYIAIDALVFLPWFLVALAAMLILLAALVGAALLAQQPLNDGIIATTLGLGAACATLLACLLLPLGFLTLRLRTLAFRDTAVFHHTPRRSISHTWRVIRANLGNTLLLIGLLWGVEYVAGLLLTAVGLPLHLLPILLNLGEGSLAGYVVGLATAVLLAAPHALLFVYVAIVWTLGYRELSEAG